MGIFEILVMIFKAKIVLSAVYSTLGITKENRFYSVDFEIKSPSTGEIYYWEHLGMMDKDFYIGKAIEKLTDYSRVGIVCGKNLILTLEDEQHKIDEEIIRKIVKEVLA